MYIVVIQDPAHPLALALGPLFNTFADCFTPKAAVVV